MLVLVSVFKTACEARAVSGGFDSHAVPPYIIFTNPQLIITIIEKCFFHIKEWQEQVLPFFKL
ncbi:hypothetical protein AAV98_00475 [Bacillus sp. CHD6a]|nr:hypothetical protein AAV98_00475 [Bacillus sp. CHD6a]